MQKDAQLFDEKTELERKLGLPETLSIVVNRIIGSGIFRTPAPIMFITASVGLFYGVWIIGGLATILGALCYAELVAMMPKSGGPYVFLKAAYPPIVTFLRGWAMFFVSETGAIAAVSVFFSETALTIINPEISKYTIAAVATILVWLLTLLNSFGIQLSGRLQNIFSLLKIGVLTIIIIMGFSSGIHPENFRDPDLSQTSGWAGIVAIFTAMRYGFFAYSGWEGATYVAEEVKNPRKNLPRSLFIGISLVLVLYLLINTAYINTLGPIQMGKAKVVAADAMQVAAGTIGTLIITSAIMVSTFGNVNTQLLVKSRTWYAMARDKLFFGRLSTVHIKYKTPNNALYAQALWTTLLILFSTVAENAYEAIIDYFSFTSSVFNVLTFASVIVLRYKFPDKERPYRVWAFPFTITIVLAIQLIFMLTTLYTAPLPSLLGIILTSTGLLYYKYMVPSEAKLDTSGSADRGLSQ
ncbi:APC family permease [Desertivirga brevis]|uniref:APC family permease n=1 Tax=Desertivirga brevis TaxID=2810310 RepID=UPI001A959A51|nr:amino acid permease [Pedobacter sp. SYSU D00873]